MDGNIIMIRKGPRLSRFSLTGLCLAGLFFVLINSTVAQEIHRLEKNLPSVYLKYDRTEDRKTRCTGEEGRHVVLQLHNNTNTNIDVGANFTTDLAPEIMEHGKTPEGTPITFLRSTSDVELCYDVESIFTQKRYEVPVRKSTPKRKNPYCSCAYRLNGKSIDRLFAVGYWVRSGDFIRFSVPERFLKKYFKVFTTFNYPWEFTSDHLGWNEPQHHVFFYYSDLPDYVDWKKR